MARTHSSHSRILPHCVNFQPPHVRAKSDNELRKILFFFDSGNLGSGIYGRIVITLAITGFLPQFTKSCISYSRIHLASPALQHVTTPRKPFQRNAPHFPRLYNNPFILIRHNKKPFRISLLFLLKQVGRRMYQKTYKPLLSPEINF